MPTKDKILDAALSLFAENGYDGTSVEQIAKSDSRNVRKNAWNTSKSICGIFARYT